MGSGLGKKEDSYMGAEGEGRAGAETLTPVNFHPSLSTLHLAFSMFKIRTSPLSLALSSELERTLDSVVLKRG